MLFESFRTINGECNNINHPSWGSSTSAFTRLLDQQYADGKDIPRGGWLSAVEPGNTGKRTNNKQCKGYSKKIDSTFLPTGYQAKRIYSEVECKYPTSYTLLPNPRRVSMEFHDGYGNPDKDVIGEKVRSIKSNTNVFFKFQRTLLFVFMGQFLDHDLALTPEPEVDHEECCTNEAEHGIFDEKCFPIVVPPSDTKFRKDSGS